VKRNIAENTAQILYKESVLALNRLIYFVYYYYPFKHETNLDYNYILSSYRPVNIVTITDISHIRVIITFCVQEHKKYTHSERKIRIFEH
jgi:hypothetical protein